MLIVSPYSSVSEGHDETNIEWALLLLSPLCSPIYIKDCIALIQQHKYYLPHRIVYGK